MDLTVVKGIAERLCSSRCWGAPEYIDHGASAAVYRIETERGVEALKIYDPALFQGENALIETKRIELQRQLISHGCPYLVDVFDTGELVDGATWYLRMEFCPWKSLEKRLAAVPDEKVHLLLKQLVLAVKFLDTKGLVHRDIKPANIVVSDNFEHLKLLDFGVIRRIAYDEGSGTEGFKFIATAQYSPPEFLGREECRGEAGFDAINIYQIGAVLHDLITKAAIFAEEKATKNKFILYKAVTEKYPRVMNASISPRLIALCLAALDKNPKSRAASVKIDDFLADADDLPTLRRRLSRSGANKVSSSNPTLAVWRPKVSSWGRRAAQLEAEALGAITMKLQKLANGHRWTLDFESARAPIYLDLITVDGGLAVHVLSFPDVEREAPTFVIGAEGPNLPETGIPGVLAARYLYALDLALTTQAKPEDQT